VGASRAVVTAAMKVASRGLSSYQLEDASLRIQMDDSGDAHLPENNGTVCNTLRRAVGMVIETQHFEMLMGLVILGNIVLIIMETDSEARCYPAYMDNIGDCPTLGGRQLPWLHVANMSMLALYTVESCLRLFVQCRQFFKSRWNCFDVIIVFAGWLNVIISSIVSVKFAFLRFFRIARLLRVLRIFIAFRELYLLMTGLYGAMKTILWGGLMLFAMLTLWSIIVVDFVHPWNTTINYDGCSRCASGFQSVMESSLTLFQQIVAGDSWGAISVPVILEHPWTALILVSIMLTISLGLMNLILAVIVERAAEARERDVENRLKEKRREQEEQKAAMLELCSNLDKDGDGTLSLQEFLFAYDNNLEFKRKLQLMDIQREELKAVFKVLDQDSSGDVSYTEFCDKLHEIQTRDTRTMLTFIKLNVSEVRQRIEDMLDEIAKLSKAFGEHSATCRQKFEFLEAIDGKVGELTTDLRTVCGSGHAPHEAAGTLGHKEPKQPSDRAALTFSSPYADSKLLMTGSSTIKDARDIFAIQKPAEMKSQGLFQQAQELAALQGSILQCVTEQAKELEQRACAGHDNILLARVEELIRLRETTRQDLASFTRELEWKLEARSAAIARSIEILGSLSTPGVPRTMRSESKSSAKRSMDLKEDPREARVSAWSQPRDVALCACTSVHKMPRARPTSRMGAHALT